MSKEEEVKEEETKVDDFSSGLFMDTLKHAARSDDPCAMGDAIDLINTFKIEGGSISETDRLFALEHTGKRVLTPGGTGTVRGPNMANAGVYPGDRYPIIVVMDKTRDTYEYDRSSLKFKATNQEEVDLYAVGYLTPEELALYRYYSKYADVSDDELELKALEKDNLDLLEYPVLRRKARESLTIDL